MMKSVEMSFYRKLENASTNAEKSADESIDEKNITE